MRKKLSLTANIKAMDDEEGLLKIEGLASTNAVDRDGDSILPSAWELKDFLKNPILLEQHDHNKPIGKITDISVVSNGLHIVAEISATAGKTATLIKEGILKSFSVGFSLLDGVWEEDTDHFSITKASLHEISVVSIPANADAIFSIAKAFDDNESYKEFKKEFTKPEEDSSKLNQEEEEVYMSTEVLTGVEKLSADLEKRLEAMEAREQKAMDDAASAAAADKEQAFKDAEASKVTMAKELEDLRGDLAEKASELKALNESKMAFIDKSTGSVSDRQVDEAVFLAKALGRSVADTAMGKALLEKAASGPHLAPNTMANGWEEQYNSRVYNDMKNLLVVEPLFNSIAMSAPTMYLPINPEAGVAEWINPTAYGSTDGTSTGTAAVHALKEQTMQAYKLASKEYISEEEEEDSLIALMPIIRDAVVRRMANASDIAILRGQASGVTDPIAGLTSIAATDTNVLATADQPSIGAGDRITVDMLGKIREKLGIWGLNPMDVVYVVSSEGYYDLLADPDFRTMNEVGTQASILTGQIGSLMGSPVLVSTSFEAKGAAKTFAIAVNKRNFMTGTLRGLTSERDYSVEDQTTVLVSTRRMGFMQTIAGQAIASGEYKA